MLRRLSPSHYILTNFNIGVCVIYQINDIVDFNSYFSIATEYLIDIGVLLIPSLIVSGSYFEAFEPGSRFEFLNTTRDLYILNWPYKSDPAT